MEDTLRACWLLVRATKPSLNPCFNGRYSQSDPFTRTAEDYGES